MNHTEHFAVVAIPLSRPEIVDFLIPPVPQPRGAKIRKIAQRPTLSAEARWIEQLRRTPNPTAADLLTLDDPHTCLQETTTDRLVPVGSLAMPNFLTRDLGGWVANYFAPLGLPRPLPPDPLLNHLEILTGYGDRLRYFGADVAQVSARLAEETGIESPAGVAAAFIRLHQIRRQMSDQPLAYADRIYAEIAQGSGLATADQPPIPKIILLDELMAQLVRLELRRRQAQANADNAAAEKIGGWQESHRQEFGLRLILQGEYIVGRHRRSTVLIAPELDAVVKQPGTEPFHEIRLADRQVHGRPENWPATTQDGALVTARGRIRLTLEEGLVPRLNRVFNHNMRLSSLLGLTVEPFVRGLTVQDYVLQDHSRLTPHLYESIVLHQQVCEVLGIDNDDWHAPNFVKRHTNGEIVHIDWGAARPLSEADLTPEGKLARLNQVSNMAFSFKDPDLAVRLKTIHAELLTDEARMARLRQKAIALVEAVAQK